MNSTEVLRFSDAPRWPLFAAVIVLATLLRGFFYSGFFGSDEVTYVGSAYRLLGGDWVVREYVGANRYGVNLPIAAFGAVFGRNEFSAAAYSLLCSLVEVAIVVGLGARLVGQRGAMLAGVLLASLPVHVHIAGRLMADAPFALAATASFLFFAEGEARRSRWWWFLAGCAAGWTFWIKPAAVFYIGILLVYPLLFRRFTWQWICVVFGFALVVLANNLYFFGLTDRFWFIFEVSSDRRASGYMHSDLASGQMHNHAAYYLEHLFGKVYHTWLLGPLFLIGCLLAWRRRATMNNDERWGVGYVAFWGLGLLIVLSLLVVKFHPLTLIPKQTNYMLIFVAPLCLLAGWLLAQLRGWPLAGALALWLAPAMLLGAMLQATTTVFTSNSKGAIAFARANPGAVVYVSSNAFRAGRFEHLVRSNKSAGLAFESMSNALTASNSGTARRLAIVDTETMAWGSSEPFSRLQDVPACWKRLQTLEPKIEGFGPWAMVRLSGLLEAVSLPVSLVQRVRALAAPRPAFVYEVPTLPCS